MATYATERGSDMSDTIAIHCVECDNYMSMMRYTAGDLNVEATGTNWAGDPWHDVCSRYADSDRIWVCDDCGAWADDDDLVNKYGVTLDAKGIPIPI